MVHGGSPRKGQDRSEFFRDDDKSDILFSNATPEQSGLPICALSVCRQSQSTGDTNDMRARLEVNQTKAQNAPDTSALAGLDQLITTAVVFLAVFLLGRFFASRVQLPFSNPDGIV